MSDPGWSGEYRVAGGPGPTRVDVEELTFTCSLLEGAADHLDTAAWAVSRAALVCDPLTPAGAQARHALTSANDGPGSPWRTAEHLRALAAALRRVIELYVETESTAHRLLRVAVAGGGSALGEHPLTAVLLGAAALRTVATVAVVSGGIVAVGSISSPSLNQVFGWYAGRFVHDLPGRSTTDGRAELLMLGVASFVRSSAPGRQVPTLHPVPDAARLLFGYLPPAGPTALLVDAHPPQLPAPRSTADVLQNVAGSYDGPGVPEGTFTVQQLTRPDGSRSWVVEIPGTEDWGINADNAMDSTTNGRLGASLPDDMTDAVLDAMRLCGIAPDEPVMLAGHSQSGMVAMSVAAAAGTAYRVRAVVTAGAPDLTPPVPASVQVRHYRHVQDGVPQVDGIPDQPARNIVVVTRDLPRERGVLTPLDGHDVHRYVQTAAQADEALAGSPAMRGFDQAADDVLGPPGTTAVTRRFQVTRDPALVATVPPRVLPSR